MKDRVLVLLILYFFGLSYFFGAEYVSTMNTTIRTKVLMGPLLLSIITSFRDIYDALDGKYTKKMIIPTILNLVFFIFYIALLNTYIDKGLF